MTKTEFIKLAKEAGYDEEEIQDFVKFHEDSGIPYDDMPLERRFVD